MKIAKVYTERSVYSLDRPFSYYIKDSDYVVAGTRVLVNFHDVDIVGYVESVEIVNQSREEYEKENGFELKDIDKVLDDEPLLNDELVSLAHYLSYTTVSTLISCYMCMLPPSLKPNSSKKTSIKTNKAVKFIKDTLDKLTDKQRLCLDMIKNHEYFVNDLVNLGFNSQIESLEKKGLVITFNKENYRDPLKNNEYTKIKDYELTNDQVNVLNEINNSNDSIYLLEGVTGSGKTEIYIRLARDQLLKNKNVLIIVPEISLTPQMIRQFKERFDEPIAVLHSALSSGEKYDEYRKIKRNEVRIVIGARSAIFAPLSNIGLIVVDEEHSDSYKEDNDPNYQLIEVANKRREYHNCKLILGSATPSVESKTRAIKGMYHELHLTKRINNLSLPSVEVIDMTKEIREGNYDLLSRKLKDEIQNVIDDNKQVLLLLNRRGYSLNLQCTKCGYSFKCDNCNISMHYHKADNTLKCHYCGKTITKPDTCPKCGSKYIRFLGVGSQKLEEYISANIKNAKVARLDLDTTNKKGSLEKTLKDFGDHKYNILLGTQIISKGLDYPDVELVGVVDADTSLNISDFRNNERSFQLLTQVIGRCGRGENKGKAFIQTRFINNPILKYIITQDYVNFYINEMAYRKQMGYPPYKNISSVIVSATKKENAYKDALEVKEIINELNEDDSLVILGPSEPILSNEYHNYKYRLILKYKDRSKMIELLNKLKKEGVNSRISIKIDTNPTQNI